MNIEINFQTAAISEDSYWNCRGKYQTQYDTAYKKYVQKFGEPETLQGMMLSSICNLYYEFFNNGFCNLTHSIKLDGAIQRLLENDKLLEIEDPILLIEKFYDKAQELAEIPNEVYDEVTDHWLEIPDVVLSDNEIIELANSLECILDKVMAFIANYNQNEKTTLISKTAAAELLENQEFISTLMNCELDHAQAALSDMDREGDEGTIQDLIDQVNYNSYSYYSPGFEQTLAQMDSLSCKLKSYLKSLEQ